MKWFMHQSQAHRDTKLKKVLMKFGAEGYGLYWYCLEQICADIDPKLTFELEHDAEILAHELRIDTLKVQDMMVYMVNLGLFESADNYITCMRLARYLGDKNTRNPKLVEIIKDQKQALSSTVRDRPRPSALEEIRLEEIRGEKPLAQSPAVNGAMSTQTADSLFNDFWQVYPKKVDKQIAFKAFKKLKPTVGFVGALVADIQKRIEIGEWIATDHRKQFIPGPGPYLNGRKWENEYIPRADYEAPQDFSAIAREFTEL